MAKAASVNGLEQMSASCVLFSRVYLGNNHFTKTLHSYEIQTFRKRLALIGKMTSYSLGAEPPQPYAVDPPVVAHGLPTLEQQEAIALLKGQDINDFFAYLKYARSAVGSPQRREGSRGEGTGLSLEQVNAIGILSGCADRKLRTWLSDAGVSGTSPSFRLSHHTALTASCRRCWNSRGLPEQLSFSLQSRSDPPSFGRAWKLERSQVLFDGPLSYSTACQCTREALSLSLHSLQRTSIL